MIKTLLKADQIYFFLFQWSVLKSLQAQKKERKENVFIYIYVISI